MRLCMLILWNTDIVWVWQTYLITGGSIGGSGVRTSRGPKPDFKRPLLLTMQYVISWYTDRSFSFSNKAHYEGAISLWPRQITNKSQWYIRVHNQCNFEHNICRVYIILWDQIIQISTNLLWILHFYKRRFYRNTQLFLYPYHVNSVKMPQWSEMVKLAIVMFYV